MPSEVAAQPTPTVNQDSIAAAERARQDSIAAVERARQDSIARVEQMRRDSIAAAEKARQDSIAAAEKARQDSIARADSIAQAEALAIRMRRWAGGAYIGIAGGATMTTGDLSNSANIDVAGGNPSGGYGTGWNITVPIGWDFTGNPFGLRIDGSWGRLAANNFTSSGSSYHPSDLNVAQLNGDVKLRVPLGRTYSRFYVLGGGGVSRFYGYSTTPLTGGNTVSFGNASNKWGWNAGGGFNFNFGRMTGLFLEARYMSFSTDANTGFPYTSAHTIPIILGIQF